MDPEHKETSDWLNQNWNRGDRNAWEQYFWPYMTGYGENIPATQEKGETKRRKVFRGAAK